MDNGIADRRALRRKVTFWRSLAIVVLVVVLAAVWFRWPGVDSPAVNQIARISITGLIQDDQDLTARLDRIAKADNVKALIVDIFLARRDDLWRRNHLQGAAPRG